MNVSATELFRQVWPDWVLGPVIGHGAFATVYEASRRDGVAFSRAAVKIIRIPSDDNETDTLRAEGLTGDQTEAYLKSIVDECLREIRTMDALKGQENVVYIEDYKILKLQDEAVWYIFIRMPLLTPLRKAVSLSHGVTEDMVIRVGIDICKALEVCRDRKIIHRDIKPENIFIDDRGNYLLGDFGVARGLEEATHGLTRKGTPNYMAPELYKAEMMDAAFSIASRVDIYSLGLVLYQMGNHMKLPFYPKGQQVISASERMDAFTARLSGETLPPPDGVSPALRKIILKAAAYDPKDRYALASDMRKDLEALLTPDELVETVPQRKKSSLRIWITVTAVAVLLAVGTSLVIGRIFPPFGPDVPVDKPIVTEKTTPTDTPTIVPTPIPTDTPSPVPTATPTPESKATLTPIPTDTPSPAPTATPTTEPKVTLTPIPTDTPSRKPTEAPSPVPTATLTSVFSNTPSPVLTTMLMSTPHPLEAMNSEQREIYMQNILKDNDFDWPTTKEDLANVTAIIPELAGYLYICIPTPTVEALETLTATPLATPSLVTTTVALPYNSDCLDEAKDSLIHVGDYVFFGVYEQDNNISNGKEPIEWRVLAVDGDKVFLVSRYGLDLHLFHNANANVTWSDCDMRQWLNEDFLRSAFNSSEQSNIQTITVHNDSTTGYDFGLGKDIHPQYGPDTLDKIFLLSWQETQLYFNNVDDLKCKASEFAEAQGAKVMSNGFCWWWLRSPGYTWNMAMGINSAGKRVPGDQRVNNNGNNTGLVRPALWVNINNFGSTTQENPFSLSFSQETSTSIENSTVDPFETAATKPIDMTANDSTAVPAPEQPTGTPSLVQTSSQTPELTATSTIVPTDTPSPVPTATPMVEATEKPRLKGDLNGDGAVDQADYVYLLRCLQGNEGAEPTAACDLSGDGALGNDDLVIMMRILSGSDAAP